MKALRLLDRFSDTGAGRVWTQVATLTALGLMLLVAGRPRAYPLEFTGHCLIIWGAILLYNHCGRHLFTGPFDHMEHVTVPPAA